MQPATVRHPTYKEHPQHDSQSPARQIPQLSYCIMFVFLVVLLLTSHLFGWDTKYSLHILERLASDSTCSNGTRDCHLTRSSSSTTLLATSSSSSLSLSSAEVPSSGTQPYPCVPYAISAFQTLGSAPPDLPTYYNALFDLMYCCRSRNIIPRYRARPLRIAQEIGHNNLANQGRHDTFILEPEEQVAGNQQ